MTTPAEVLRNLKSTVDSLDMDQRRSRALEEAVSCTEQCADNLAALDDATATTAQIARINDALGLIAQLQRVMLDIAEQEASRDERPSMPDGMSQSKHYRETYGDGEAA
jgi:hypothetical protein